MNKEPQEERGAIESGKYYVKTPQLLRTTE